MAPLALATMTFGFLRTEATGLSVTGVLYGAADSNLYCSISIYCFWICCCFYCSYCYFFYSFIILSGLMVGGFAYCGAGTLIAA